MGPGREPRRRCGPVVPPQDGFDPGHHLPWAEGLGDVIVGAQLQSGDPVGLSRPSGHKDDRDLGERRRLAEVAAKIEAVAARQHDVEQKETGVGYFSGLHYPRTIQESRDGEPRSFQMVTEEKRNIGLVLDHEYVRLHRNERWQVPRPPDLFRLAIDCCRCVTKM
jgi:hypothetical protein